MKNMYYALYKISFMGEITDQQVSDFKNNNRKVLPITADDVYNCQIFNLKEKKKRKARRQFNASVKTNENFDVKYNIINIINEISYKTINDKATNNKSDNIEKYFKGYVVFKFNEKDQEESIVEILNIISNDQFSVKKIDKTRSIKDEAIKANFFKKIMCVLKFFKRG